MFLKLFRHDFKGLGRWMWPVMIGIGGAAVLGFINTLVLGRSARADNFDMPGSGFEKLLVTSVGLTALVFMALAMAATVIAVLLFVRFYKSMVTDEAYLTFTLPVTAGQLIGAKFLSATVWALIGGIGIFLAFCVIGSGLLVTGGADAVAFFREMAEDMGEILAENGGVVLLLLLYGITGAVRTYFQVTCAILFGASVVRKNKALAAVGMVFAVNFAVNLILSLSGVSGMMALVFGIGSEIMDIQPMLWIQIAVNVLLIAVFWWWSWRIAKKSVNIE